MLKQSAAQEAYQGYQIASLIFKDFILWEVEKEFESV